MERYITSTVTEQWQLVLIQRADGVHLLSAKTKGKPIARGTRQIAKLPAHVREYCLISGNDDLTDLATLAEVKNADDLKVTKRTSNLVHCTATIQHKTARKNPALRRVRFDEYGHAVSPNGDRLTDPYGKIEWAIGSGDDFYCFDAARVAPGLIAIHSTINSETGSFIQDGAYEVVRAEDAVATAQGFCDQAWDWCVDNGIRYNRRNCERDQRHFLQYVQQLVKGA